MTRKLTGFCVAALVVSACSAADELSSEAVAQEAASAKVLVLGDGIKLNREDAAKLSFGAKKEEVLGALETAIGKPRDLFVSEGCENGPLEIAEFPGTVYVNFEGGNFVGWALSLNKNPDFATPEGITIGTPSKTAEERLTLIRSGMSFGGIEYSSPAGYTLGMMDMGEGQAVSMIDAGRVCYR